MPEMPSVGDDAPDFEGRTQTGEVLRLRDLAGEKVALYFYPKDDTPGCTKQACSLRDGYHRLREAGIAVVGVSADDVSSHQQFAEKYNLPFPIVADPERRIVQQYGVWGERTLYGRKFMGINRVTFLIDADGKIRDVIKRPKVEEHDEEVLKRFGVA